MTLSAHITDAWTIGRERNSTWSLTVRGKTETELVIYPNGIIEVCGQTYHCSSLDMAIELVGGMGIKEWWFQGRWLEFD